MCYWMDGWMRGVTPLARTSVCLSLKPLQNRGEEEEETRSAGEGEREKLSKCDGKRGGEGEGALAPPIS